MSRCTSVVFHLAFGRQRGVVALEIDRADALSPWRRAPAPPWTRLRISGRVFESVAPDARAAHPYLPNGDFDSDINGWILPTTPDTTISWDAFGNPGGSLAVSSTFDSTGEESAIRILSACINQPGIYAISGQVYSPSSAAQNCQVDLIIGPSVDCSGDFVYPVFNGSNTFDNWFDLPGNATQLVLESPGPRSLRMSLTVLRPDNNSLGVCYFDNIELEAPNLVPQIPVVQPIGLGSLAVLVACLALARLRKTRTPSAQRSRSRRCGHRRADSLIVNQRQCRARAGAPGSDADGA